MNPLIYIILAIISIFIFFIYLSSLYTVYEPPHALYEHTGACPTASFSFCFELKNFYFQTVASKLEIPIVEREINQWLESVDRSKKHQIEVKYNAENKRFFAYAIEDFQKKDTIFIHSEKTIFSKLSLAETNFNEHMNKSKLIDDQYAFSKLNLTSIPNVLIMNLVYHIYHLEFSNFRPWIQTFPVEMSSFFSRLTQFEYNQFIKTNKEVWAFVKDYYETLERDWKNLEYLLKKRLTIEERNSLFNRKSFTKADFIFAKIITERHGWSLGTNDKELIMYPGNDFFIRKNVENENSYTNYFRQQTLDVIDEETLHFKLLADRNITKGGLIYQSFFEPRSFLSAFLYGDMPKYSFLDCTLTEVFYYEDIFNLNEYKKQFLRWASESGILCLNLNPYSLARLKIIGSIFNMDNEEIKNCLEIVQKGKSLEEQYQTFIESCANPEWKNFDPRKITLKNMNATINFLVDYHENAKTYLNMRKINGKDTRNAQILVDYSEEKIKMNQILIEKIKNLTNNRFEDLEFFDQEKTIEKADKEKKETNKEKSEL